jgi:hypothetical protein
MKWLGQIAGLSVSGVLFFLASTSPEEAAAHFLAWWTWFNNLKLVDWLVHQFPSLLPIASGSPVRLVATLVLMQVLALSAFFVLLGSMLYRIKRLTKAALKFAQSTDQKLPLGPSKTSVRDKR